MSKVASKQASEIVSNLIAQLESRLGQDWMDNLFDDHIFSNLEAAIVKVSDNAWSDGYERHNILTVCSGV